LLYRQLIGLWAAAFLLLGSLVGCANQRIASDLKTYVNDGILSVADLEARALADYAAVVGSNYTSDLAVYQALRYQVVPQYESFLLALKDMAPHTREVIQLHALYVRGAETMLHGFEIKLRGLENGNVALIMEGNAAIEKGRVQTERWRARIDTLFKKYAVRPEKRE